MSTLSRVIRAELAAEKDVTLLVWVSCPDNPPGFEQRQWAAEAGLSEK